MKFRILSFPVQPLADSEGSPQKHYQRIRSEDSRTSGQKLGSPNFAVQRPVASTTQYGMQGNARAADRIMQQRHDTLQSPKVFSKLSLAALHASEQSSCRAELARQTLDHSAHSMLLRIQVCMQQLVEVEHRRLKPRSIPACIAHLDIIPITLFSLSGHNQSSHQEALGRGTHGTAQWH